MDGLKTSVVIVLLVGLASVGVAGCDGLPYVLHLAQGQLGIQGRVEPIDGVLASGRLATDDQAKLQLIVLARDFAAEVMGLDAAGQYDTFYDSSGDPVAFNLSAARRDALVPRTWAFPFVGEVPYLAFFDEAYLRRIEQQLRDDGYDTMTYELDAYSTLGIFEDPVRSTMLRRSDLSLIETIIHELLHNTVYRPNATVFNESLATFVGRQGAVDFLRIAGDDESAAIAEAYYDDLDAVNAFLLGLYAELEAYYAQPLTSEEKVAGREAVYAAGRARFGTDVLPTLNYPGSFASYSNLPTNNAWMLAHYRYNLDLDLIRSVYATLDGDWPAAIAVYRQAAQSPDDPFQFLRDWQTAQTGRKP